MHHQLVVAPDQQVAEVVTVCLLMKGVFVKKAQLLRFFAVSRLVNGLDALQGQRGVRQVHRATVAVLVVLALPDQFGFHVGKWM